MKCTSHPGETALVVAMTDIRWQPFPIVRKLMHLLENKRNMLKHNSEGNCFFRFFSSALLQEDEMEVSLTEFSKVSTRFKTSSIFFCMAVCDDKIAFRVDCNDGSRSSSVSSSVKPLC